MLAYRRLVHSSAHWEMSVHCEPYTPVLSTWCVYCYIAVLYACSIPPCTYEDMRWNIIAECAVRVCVLWQPSCRSQYSILVYKTHVPYIRVYSCTVRCERLILLWIQQFGGYTTSRGKPTLVCLRFLLIDFIRYLQGVVKMLSIYLNEWQKKSKFWKIFTDI